MANPNSPLTWVRFHLARWLDPYPDRGEAWCMNCTLNGGRTLILSAAGHTAHIERHHDPDCKGLISIRVNWGHLPGEDEGWRSKGEDD